MSSLQKCKFYKHCKDVKRQVTRHEKCQKTHKSTRPNKGRAPTTTTDHVWSHRHNISQHGIQQLGPISVATHLKSSLIYLGCGKSRMWNRAEPIQDFGRSHIVRISLCFVLLLGVALLAPWGLSVVYVGHQLPPKLSQGRPSANEPKVPPLRLPGLPKPVGPGPAMRLAQCVEGSDDLEERLPGRTKCSAVEKCR